MSNVFVAEKYCIFKERRTVFIIKWSYGLSFTFIIPLQTQNNSCLNAIFIRRKMEGVCRESRILKWSRQPWAFEKVGSYCITHCFISFIFFENVIVYFKEQCVKDKGRNSCIPAYALCDFENIIHLPESGTAATHHRSGGLLATGPAGYNAANQSSGGLHQKASNAVVLRFLLSGFLYLWRPNKH